MLVMMGLLCFASECPSHIERSALGQNHIVLLFSGFPLEFCNSWSSANCLLFKFSKGAMKIGDGHRTSCLKSMPGQWAMPSLPTLCHLVFCG